MRVVICPDSFKECLTAPEAAEAIAHGWRRVRPDDDLDLAPMADGGEGTVDALVTATGGQFVDVEVTGPLGGRVVARYGLLDGGATAVIEMAAASGLALAPPDARDPRVATTRGTGELMRHAIARGARRLIVGIGGSATNDAGCGMAQALGFALLDEADAELAPGGAALARLHRIDATRALPELAACEVWVACDVDNPLCGPRGASRVFGPQKGAAADAVDELDAALAHWAAIAQRDLGAPVRDIPGAGAAGGLGAGLMAFAGASLHPGVALVAQANHLERRIADARLVLTGEGRIDGQTAHGKTPLGVARIAAAHGVPVVALAGALGDGWKALHDLGFHAIMSISPGPISLAESMARAAELLSDAGETVARLWQE